MMLQQHIERLYQAVDRIEEQLAHADTQQKGYLFDELQALRNMFGNVFEMWVNFEDRVQELYDRFELPDEDHQIDHAALLPPASPQSAALDTEDLGMALQSDDGFKLFRRGVGYFDLLMFDDSIREFEKVVDMDPDMTVSRLYLALCYLAKKDFAKAEQHLKIVLFVAHDPAVRAAAIDANAQMYLTQNRLLDARTELERLLALKPEYVDARINLALLAYEARDYETTLAQATDVTRRDPLDHLAWRLCGAALFAMGRTMEANGFYERAVALAKDDLDLELEWAAVLRKLRRPKQARTIYQSALHSDKHVSHALYGLAELALFQQEYEEAVALYKKHMTLNPSDIKVAQRLGWALYASGRLDEAQHVLEMHRKRVGDTAFTLSGLARIKAAKKDVDGARELLHEVVRMRDRNDRVHGLTELGRLYLDLRDHARAQRYLQSALAIDRSCEDALIYLGMAIKEAQARSQPHVGLTATD